MSALATWQASTLPQSCSKPLSNFQNTDSKGSCFCWKLFNSSHCSTVKSKLLAMATRLSLTHIFKPSNLLSFSLQRPAHTNVLSVPQEPSKPQCKSVHLSGCSISLWVPLFLPGLPALSLCVCNEGVYPTARQVSAELQVQPYSMPPA